MRGGEIAGTEREKRGETTEQTEEEKLVPHRVNGEFIEEDFIVQPGEEKGQAF